jgi:hypothetical protein
VAGCQANPRFLTCLFLFALFLFLGGRKQLLDIVGRKLALEDVSWTGEKVRRLPRIDGGDLDRNRRRDRVSVAE